MYSACQNRGTAWELMNTAVKPYPSCRYGHACVDAAIALIPDAAAGCSLADSITAESLEDFVAAAASDLPLLSDNWTRPSRSRCGYLR